ncbi:S8 family peptidase [Mycoplasma sp. HU2014]|uniref:S8 family peptidase n=1 Tax=Mycoplasma sp. HU2014 TaxID=1664275 RepID=UPI00067AC6C6|nr:S8 family peptidase [Mycoplasma sp. HU2014]KNG79031.1 peptidase S8 family protein [Mycoplasma sp. HU2014]
MNSLLILKGEFDSKPNPSKPGNPKLTGKKKLELDHIKKLLDQLNDVYNFWKNQTLEIDALINVKYYSIVAKSKRINQLFYSTLKQNNDKIVGVSLIDDYKNNNIQQKHLITYYIEKNILKNAINKISIIVDKLEQNNINIITNELIDQILNNKNNISSKEIFKTQFRSIIVDLSHIEEFNVKTTHIDSSDKKIITLYDINVDEIELLKKLNINLNMRDRIGKNTFYLDSEPYNLLKEKAPYLISMSVEDLNEVDWKEDNYFLTSNSDVLTIPDPTIEPIVGVIDTMFDNRVYFSKWVEFKKEISNEIPLSQKDFNHGTAVTSIIVDGPSFNKQLEDNCGRFRVRHFGVAKDDINSTLTLYNKIKNIVENNKDIKVWNLSLGSKSEIDKNSISVMGDLLDKLQYENDVIFIVAGTNKEVNELNSKRIGSPADSINSIVVNSVDYKNNPANYSRKGPVLHFFNKPDVNYYGGTKDKPITTCTANGVYKVIGTSFAAPWITRKVAYLIHKLKFSKEEAKALIIDSAISNDNNKDIVGHGIVPIKINDIIESKNHEIKIVLSSYTKEYHTYNHEFPVPVYNNTFPFTVKATLVYFTDTNRNQGVDYTKNELDFQFGPMIGEGENLKIKPLNENKQSSHEDNVYINEQEARKEFSKWNTVKIIEKKETTKTGRARTSIKVKNNLLSWGIKVTKKYRLNNTNNDKIKFSIVITLKEIDKTKNRLEKFINLCQSSQRWYVRKIKIDNEINIFSKSNEQIEFNS